MSKSKYAKLIQPLRLGTESANPSSSLKLVYEGQPPPETKKKSPRKPKSNRS